MISFLLSACLFAADQVCKHNIERQADPNKELLGGEIQVTRYHNRGVFLSFFSGKERLVKVLSSLSFGLLLVLGVLARTRLCRVGLALLAGGGLSNQTDRYRKGYVVDYFSFRQIPQVVFNLGDMGIFLGALLALTGFSTEK